MISEIKKAKFRVILKRRLRRQGLISSMINNLDEIDLVKLFTLTKGKDTNATNKK